VTFGDVDRDLIAFEKEDTVFAHKPEISDDELGGWSIVHEEGNRSGVQSDKQVSDPKLTAIEGDGAKTAARDPLKGHWEMPSVMTDLNGLMETSQPAVDTEHVDQSDSQQEHWVSRSSDIDSAANHEQTIAVDEQIERRQADVEQLGRQQQIVDIFPTSSDDAALSALPSVRDDFHKRLRMHANRRRLRRQPRWDLYQPPVTHRSRARSSPRNQLTATCSGCGSPLLPVVRYYTCKVCPDYDLCSSCFADHIALHDPSHVFLIGKQSSVDGRDIVGYSMAAQDTITKAELLLTKALRSAEDAAAAAATKLSDMLLQTGWRPLHS